MTAVDASTDPTALLNRPCTFGHMVGTFTDLRHLAIDTSTGRSQFGLEPGLVGSFCEQPSPACRGGNTAVYVQYGEAIDFNA